MTSIVPLGNRIVLERVKPEQPKSFIVLPDSAQEESKEFRVIAVGGGVTQVKVGDDVIYNRRAASEVVDYQFPDLKLLMVSEEDIFAIRKKA